MTPIERALTAAERAELQKVLTGLPTAVERIKRGLGNALLIWAVTLGIFAVVWRIVAWLATRFAHVGFGWNSSSALPILATGTVICGIYAAVSTLRWMRGWRNLRPLILQDLARGLVTEENLEFTAAKRFQEPEHGGLIYFLRTRDDRVFVLFDHLSQDLGVQGKNPFSSRFEPKAHFCLIRAPASRYVLSSSFSGPPLQLVEPLYLGAPPKRWPESEEFCDIRWDDLESQLGANE